MYHPARHRPEARQRRGIAGGGAKRPKRCQRTETVAPGPEFSARHSHSNTELAQLHSTVPSALNPRPPQASHLAVPPEASHAAHLPNAVSAGKAHHAAVPPRAGRKVLLEARPAPTPQHPLANETPGTPVPKEGAGSARRGGGGATAYFGRRGEAPKDAPRRRPGAP